MLNDLKPGDSVYLVPARSGWSHKVLTVTKVGRKYITTDNGAQFGKETGIQKTDYISDKIYRSEDHYKAELKHRKNIQRLNEFFVRGKSNHLTPEQATKILEIIGLSEDDAEA